MPNHANDNAEGFTPARIIEPFHRLYASGLLHKTKATNDALYYVGEKYSKDYGAAGGTLLKQPPAYVKPLRRMNDEYRGVPTVLVDKCLSYHQAAQTLDALEIREVVEGIVVYGQQIVDVGKRYSGYSTTNQARAAAITAIRIGLIALKLHYGMREAA
jgi:hypothetical protein